MLLNLGSGFRGVLADGASGLAAVLFEARDRVGDPVDGRLDARPAAPARPPEPGSSAATVSRHKSSRSYSAAHCGQVER